MPKSKRRKPAPKPRPPKKHQPTVEDLLFSGFGLVMAILIFGAHLVFIKLFG